MKAGRPTYRVHAKWVTYKKDNQEMYYQLNAKGELVKTNGKLTPELRPLNVKEQDSNSANNQAMSSAPLPLPMINEEYFPFNQTDFASKEMDVFFMEEPETAFDLEYETISNQSPMEF